MFHDTASGPGGSSQYYLAPLGSAPLGHNSCEPCPVQGDNRRKSIWMQSIVVKFHCCSVPPTDLVSLPSWLQGKKLAAARGECCRWMVCHGHIWTELAHRCCSGAWQLPSSPQIFVSEGLKGRRISLLTWSTGREAAMLGELVEGSKPFPPRSSGPGCSAREGMEGPRAGQGGCCLANQVSAGSPTGTAELAGPQLSTTEHRGGLHRSSPVVEEGSLGIGEDHFLSHVALLLPERSSIGCHLERWRNE